MLAPGFRSLGSSSELDQGSNVITATHNRQGQAVAYVADLEGALSLTIEAELDYGSGGGTLKVYVQTSLDQGATWMDIANLAFAQADAKKVINVSALTPKTTPATPGDATLADNTCIDGVLGDRVRVKAVASAAYVDSQLSVGMIVR